MTLGSVAVLFPLSPGASANQERLLSALGQSLGKESVLQLVKAIGHSQARTEDNPQVAPSQRESSRSGQTQSSTSEQKE